MLQTPSQVTVVFAKRGREQRLQATRAVLAVPPRLASALELAPALSSEKRAALAALGLESVTRVWLEADRRFWLERGESGRVETDFALGPVRDESEGLPGPGGVLGVYATRAEARRLARLSEPERVARVLEQVERAQPGMRAHCVATASKCWDSEPFIRGAYAFFQPGQLEAFGEPLRRAEGRLHFCGDHTSRRPGFMHGAVASAWRVVDEITRGA